MSAARQVAAVLVSELVAGRDVVGSEVVTGPEVAGSDTGPSFPPQPVAASARGIAKAASRAFMVITFQKMFPILTGLDLGEISPVNSEPTMRGRMRRPLYSASGHGSPQAKNVQIAPRQAPLDAQALHSRARRVSAVPPAEAATPRLPDLRHL
jgi:hypothetical protein